MDAYDEVIGDLAVPHRFKSALGRLMAAGMLATPALRRGLQHDGPSLRVPGTGPAALCAESVALACAYREGLQAIEAVAADDVSPSASRVIAPCGQCRELMLLFGDPWVIVPTADGPRKIRLRDLHPLAG